jgi:hypothetical protein
MLRWSSRSSMAAAIIGSSKIYSRVGTGAAVRTVHLAAPAADEDQASAGARSAPTALLHPWKAAVPLPLSRSMQLDTAARRRRATHALLLSRELGTLAETRSAPAVGETQAFAGLTIRRRGLLLRRSRPSHLTAARSKRSGSCSSSRRQISKGLERDSIRRRAISRSTDGRRPLHCHFLV